MTTNALKKDTPLVAAADRHGQIRCGTISVRDLDRSLSQYSELMDLKLVEEGVTGTVLADNWGLSGMVDAPYALLQPTSGSLSFIRLIEVTPGPAFEPATTLGWNAFEISVKEVFSLSERLKSSDFKVVGPPKLVDGFTNFIPMQVFGPDGEVLFLNQVVHSDEMTDLPKAESRVDQLFIAVVASQDREKTADEQARYLGLETGPTHSLRYSLINRAFDLDPETQQTITMVNKGRYPFSQVDQYPAAATTRPVMPGMLPPANSVLSVMVDSIDDLPVGGVVQGELNRPEGHLYQGRRVQTIKGSASELIELIEI